MPEKDSQASGRAFEELDLMIHNMDTPGQESEVKLLLDGLPGIPAATIVQGGVWLRYHGDTISKEQICAVLHRAGYRAGVFQDSKSKAVGTSSQ